MAAAGEGQIVRRDQRGELMLAMQTGDQLKHCFRGVAIQVSGRLVR